MNEKLIAEWLDKQPPAARKWVESDVPLYERGFNRFSFVVKPNIKPAMELGAVNKYANVQTIADNSKDVNVIFYIFNIMRERLFSFLKSKFNILCDLSIEECEVRVNKVVDVAGLCSIENDFSKYDKAHAEALFVFEMLLYEALGMDPDLLEIWKNSHSDSILTGKINGVKIEAVYQRKSGDASTFFGNTVVLMAVLAAVLRF